MTKLPPQILSISQSLSFDTNKIGIALIDQHGAHERILYEQFMEAFLKQKKELPQYHLSTPKLFDLSFSEENCFMISSSIRKTWFCD